ncbi:MAG: hypothetical protein ACKVTZ_05835, partial [Bacteroidia bacterium]
MKKLFKIVSQTEAYQPLPGFEAVCSIYKGLPSNIKDRTQGTVKLYLSATAQNTIFNHIGWGKTTDTNGVEQGGIMLGQTYIEPETGIQFGHVEQVVCGYSGRGSSAYLDLGHDVWKEMLDEVDELLELEKTPLQIIGWYHTHPNSLPVFMSGTDRNTQQFMFGQTWQYAIVLNPHKKIWRAFYGTNSDECQGYFL